jgi:hypothetical protein
MEHERIMTEQEARALAELRLRKPLAPRLTDGEGVAKRKALMARYTAPLDKMKRQIIRAIRQIEAAKLN